MTVSRVASTIQWNFWITDFEILNKNDIFFRIFRTCRNCSIQLHLTISDIITKSWETLLWQIGIFFRFIYKNVHVNIWIRMLIFDQYLFLTNERHTCRSVYSGVTNVNILHTWVVTLSSLSVFFCPSLSCTGILGSLQIY